jgi:hypothetical protein
VTHPIATELKIVAIGHPVSVYSSPGVGWVGFQVDKVLVEDIEPPSLQGVLDCLLQMMLNGVLSGLKLSFSVFDVAFFKLILQQGPTIANNQIAMWGDVS